MILCCCVVNGNVAVTVLGCNSLALSGATVTITQGGTTVDTWTTNSTGQRPGGSASLPTGSYSYSVAKGRFTTATGSFTLTTSGSTFTVTLTAASGYICVPFCADPVKTALTFTVGGVGYAISYVGTFGGVLTWKGSTSVSDTNVVVSGACPPVTDTVPVDLYYRVSAGGTTGLSAEACGTRSGCNGFSPPQSWQLPVTGNPLDIYQGAAVVTSSCTLPTSIGGTIPATWSNSGGQTLPALTGFGGAATVTE